MFIVVVTVPMLVVLFLGCQSCFFIRMVMTTTILVKGGFVLFNFSEVVLFMLSNLAISCILRRLQEEYHAKGQKLYMCFVGLGESF